MEEQKVREKLADIFRKKLEDIEVYRDVGSNQTLLGIRAASSGCALETVHYIEHWVKEPGADSICRFGFPKDGGMNPDYISLLFSAITEEVLQVFEQRAGYLRNTAAGIGLGDVLETLVRKPGTIKDILEGRGGNSENLKTGWKPDF